MPPIALFWSPQNWLLYRNGSWWGFVVLGLGCRAGNGIARLVIRLCQENHLRRYRVRGAKVFSFSGCQATYSYPRMIRTHRTPQQQVNSLLSKPQHPHKLAHLTEANFDCLVSVAFCQSMVHWHQSYYHYYCLFVIIAIIIAVNIISCETCYKQEEKHLILKTPKPLDVAFELWFVHINNTCWQVFKSFWRHIILPALCKHRNISFTYTITS